MQKATLSPNPLPQNKQRFLVQDLPECRRVITRDTIAIELSSAERPDKTVVPIGRVNSGEFNITLDFGDDLGRGDYLKWFNMCIDKGTKERSSGANSRDLSEDVTNSSVTYAGVAGIDPGYKKLATLIYHRLYNEDNPIIVKLIGCWPSSLTLPDFDMDGEEMLTLEMTISYDDVQIIQKSAAALYGNSFGGTATTNVATTSSTGI
jgi:hypothetical protein